MDSVYKLSRHRQRAAALVIVLAFVVLLAGLAVAYLSRTTGDRQVAQSSFHQSKVDELAQSAMDSIIGDLRQEITNGSTATLQADGSTVYVPNSPANMVPQRSGNVAGVPNLIRRSIRSDSLANNPAPPSRALAVNSTTDPSANGRYINSTRWNAHYLVPKGNTATADPSPTPTFSSATPDWVFLNNQGVTTTAPSTTIVGRYAYAIYDEGGLLDMNVAGYPTGTTVTQSGRKGSTAFADLSALGNYPITNSSTPYQIDALVGWRNYATTQPLEDFPDTSPPGVAFAVNFRSSTTPASSFYNFVINNANGFLSARTDVSYNLQTDQMFLGRQELTAYQKTPDTNNGAAIANTSQFNVNALQYLSTFSREANAPSFSPSTPRGSTINYVALAANPAATPVNPNFLFRRVTTSFTRFDGTTAAVGEPLVKTRFPLSRLAWITYKGPSALRTLPPQTPALPTTDPNYDMWALQWVYGVPASYLQAGTAPNIKYCFGLTFPTGGTPGSPWTYTNHKTSTDTTQANAILRLDQVTDPTVVTTPREPDFFELLQAAILSGSLGQSSGGVSPLGSTVFGALDTSTTNYMSSVTQHLLSIGAAMIDQADLDSVPTRIQFTGTNGNTWTAYGVENLPYITELYPISGTSPNDPNPSTPTQWATYLLFQLWNPHQNAPATLPASVRLRVDGAIGMFSGGNGQTWVAGTTPQIIANGGVAGQSVTLNSASSFATPAPLSGANTINAAAAPGAPTGGVFAALAAPPIPTPTP